jgi:hypothetical protein
MAHEIIEVNESDTALMATFITLPWKINYNDKNWVSPIKGDEFTLHNRSKHPFWKHGRAQYFLAVDGKRKVLGRIAGIYDPRYIEFSGENVGYWGFFECIENAGVAKSLFDAAARWLKTQNVDYAIGPMNPSTNNTCGTLIEGFDTPPYIMMTHNKPYYDKFTLDAGLTKEKDLYAWLVDKPVIPERLEKLATYAIQKGNFTIRKVDFGQLQREVDVLLGIYNSAWQKNWGFVPMTDDEFRFLAKELKVVADADLIYIAEIDSKPVGFSLSLPNFNQALIFNRNGNLFPFGLIKLLINKRKVNQVRTVTMGIIEEHRNKGIDLALYYTTFKAGLPKGYIASECSWVLEDNEPMNAVMRDIGARIHKKYRIYRLNV